MRKILLATTALVAMSVTAAQADVSISGYQQFEMKDDGAANNWDDDGAVTIKSTNTTDSGLTLTAVHSLATHDTGAGGGSVDDSYLDIKGDFGSLRAGNTDDVLDMMDGAYPANWDESGNADGGFAIGGTQADGDPRVSLTLPSISGATIYGASSNEGTFTGMGVNYSNGPVSVVYQSGSDGIVEKSLLAVNVAVSGVTVGFGSGKNDDGTNSATSKTDFSAMGLKYTVNDALKVYFVSQKQKGTEDATSMGGYYTVAPGLVLAAETSTDASDQNSTYAHVKVTF
jgi:hypothetical protein